MLSYSIYYRVLITAIAIVALLAPSLGPNSLSVTPESFKTVWGVSGVGMLLILWMLTQGINYKLIIINSPFYFPILGFIVWCFISLLWVIDYHFAAILLSQFVSQALIFFIVINSIRDSKELKHFLTLMVIVSMLVSALGLLQYYFPGNEGIQTFIRQAVPPGATFGNKNMAIHFIVMTLPLSIVFWLRATHFPKILFFTSSTILCSLFLIHSHTRAGWLSMFIEISFLSIFLLYDFLKNKKNPFIIKDGFKYKKMMILLIGLIIWIIAINVTKQGFTNNLDKVSQRFMSMSYSESKKAGNERLPAWFNTLEMIKEHPVAGVGIGQWAVHYPLYYDRVEKDKIFNEQIRLRHLHNEYLEIFANVGIIGYAFLLWLAYLVITTSYKILANVNSENRYLILGMVLALTGFTVTSNFTFPIKVYSPAVYSLVYIALIANSYFRSIGDKKGAPNLSAQQKYNHIIGDSKSYFIFSKSVNQIVFILAIIITLIAGYASYNWIKAEHHYHNALSLKQSGNIKFAISEINKSLKHNPYRAKAYTVAGGLYFKNGNSEKAIDLISQGLSISPYQTAPLLNLSQVYESKSDLKNQIKILEKLIEIDPRHVNAYAKLTRAYINAKDAKKANIAYNNMKKYFNYFKDRNGFGPYHRHVGRTATSVNDYNYAKIVFVDAIKRDPSAENYKGLGIVFYYSKTDEDKEKGIALFKQALKLNPKVSQYKKIRKIIKDFEANK